jgi:hypothetical protein
VQPYVISWMRRDPAAALAGISLPALVVRGTTDLQTGVDDTRRPAGPRGGVRLAVIAGMNHLLKAGPAERNGNLATYADPALPLARVAGGDRRVPAPLGLRAVEGYG